MTTNHTQKLIARLAPLGFAVSERAGRFVALNHRGAELGSALTVEAAWAMCADYRRTVRDSQGRSLFPKGQA